VSSLVYLGFSIVIFIISYGILFSIMPVILGYFFSIDITPTNPQWQQTKEETENVTRWLIPLMPAIGIFVLVLKVLMVASVRGRD
jgi:hypothetical protein